MKILAIPVMFCALVCGQEPPPKVAPGTKAAPVPAQPAPAAALAPDTVVATVGDKKITAAEMDKLIDSLPPQYQQAVRSAPNNLTTLFVMRHLGEMAEKDGLDKTSPYKEALEYSRLQTLAQAEVATRANKFSVSNEEEEAYYKANPDKFKQAKVRVIYVQFNPAPGKGAEEGKKLPTEAEAKAKIEDLRKQLAAGADFGKLARENSDDKASAPKDGDFGIIKKNSPYPQPIKDAVFALKAGEISEPVRQPNGFYLIRVDEFNTQPYKEIDQQLNQDLRTQKMNDWLKNIQTQYTVKVENPAYFAPKGAPLQPVR